MLGRCVRAIGSYQYGGRSEVKGPPAMNDLDTEAPIKIYGPAVRHRRFTPPPAPRVDAVPLRGSVSTIKAILISVAAPIVLGGIAFGLAFRNSTALAVVCAAAAVLAIPLTPWWIGLFVRLSERSEAAWLRFIPAPPGLIDTSRHGLESLDDHRRRATAAINFLVEDLVYDYGLMLTGQTPDLAYVTPAVVTALRQSVAPILRSGQQLRPDFGSNVQVIIDWNLDDITRPVTAEATFVDRSTRVSGDGMGVQVAPRRVRLAVAFNHQFTTIIDATIGSD